MSLDCENASPSTTAGKCVGPLQQANRYQLMSVMNPGTMPNTSSPRAERPAALADMPTPIFRRPLLVPSSTGVNYGYGFSTNVENIGRGQGNSPTSSSRSNSHAQPALAVKASPLQYSPSTGSSVPFTPSLLRNMALTATPCMFPGLLFTDGLDHRQRPVIVVNTLAFPPRGTLRQSALQYVLDELQSIVCREYVLVVVSVSLGLRVGRVSGLWALNVYRRLAKPYRKNVKHIVLVSPSAMAKAILAIMAPFVSSKATTKIKKVEALSGIALATYGEVTLESLGVQFLTTMSTMSSITELQLSGVRLPNSCRGGGFPSSGPQSPTSSGGSVRYTQAPWSHGPGH